MLTLKVDMTVGEGKPLATEPIQYEVDGHVARIWLNRPHKRNSVSQQLLEELDQARIRAENDLLGALTDEDKDIRKEAVTALGDQETAVAAVGDALAEEIEDQLGVVGRQSRRVFHIRPCRRTIGRWV
jgi:1,4-dihydroxy-2-naphthoyl-CoA synthase